MKVVNDSIEQRQQIHDALDELLDANEAIVGHADNIDIQVHNINVEEETDRVYNYVFRTELNIYEDRYKVEESQYRRSMYEAGEKVESDIVVELPPIAATHSDDELVDLGQVIFNYWVTGEGKFFDEDGNEFDHPLYKLYSDKLHNMANSRFFMKRVAELFLRVRHYDDRK